MHEVSEFINWLLHIIFVMCNKRMRALKQYYTLATLFKYCYNINTLLISCYTIAATQAVNKPIKKILFIISKPRIIAFFSQKGLFFCGCFSKLARYLLYSLL